MILRYCLLSATVIALLFSSCKHEPEDIIVNPPADTTTPNPPVVKCSPDTIYFQNEILPVIISNCAKSGCHDSLTAEENVNLTNYFMIINTGGIVPGNPGNSELYEKITESDPEDKMPPPPNPPLTLQQITSIRDWILQGAKNNRCDSLSCDTNNVTYLGSLKPITDLTCKGCHSGAQPAAGFDLSTQAGLQATAQSGRLIGAINHSIGFVPMPQGGAKLADCQIRMFEKWITLNYPK